MNNLFILGAGASKSAGGPLMADFLDIADNLVRTRDEGIQNAKKESNTQTKGTYPEAVKFLEALFEGVNKAEYEFPRLL